MNRDADAAARDRELFDAARDFTLAEEDARIAKREFDVRALLVGNERLHEALREIGERLVFEHGKGNIEFETANALAAMVEKALNG